MGRAVFLLPRFRRFKMSQMTNEPVANEPAVDRPPVTADVAPLTKIGGFKIPTAALRAYTMVFALVAIWVIFTYATSGVFLESRNFSNLMRQTAVTGVLAVGMLMVIVTGQIDLSVGSVVGLSGGVAAIIIFSYGYGMLPAVAGAIVVGLIIGAIQGALTSYANIPSFIVTLGGMLVWRGAIKGLTKGNTIPIPLQSFKNIGEQYVAKHMGVGIAVLAVAAIVLLNLQRQRVRRRHGLPTAGVLTLALRIIIPSAVIVG